MSSLRKPRHRASGARTPFPSCRRAWVSAHGCVGGTLGKSEAGNPFSKCRPNAAGADREVWTRWRHPRRMATPGCLPFPGSRPHDAPLPTLPCRPLSQNPVCFLRAFPSIRPCPRPRSDVTATWKSCSGPGAVLFLYLHGNVFPVVRGLPLTWTLLKKSVFIDFGEKQRGRERGKY